MFCAEHHHVVYYTIYTVYFIMPVTPLSTKSHVCGQNELIEPTRTTAKDGSLGYTFCVTLLVGAAETMYIFCAFG